MRKLSVVILALVAVGTVAWWVSFDSDEARARLEAEAARKSIAAALVRMLSEHEVFVFSDVVVGAAPQPGQRDFRALVQRNGALRPAYGVAEYVCPEPSPDRACWRLALLEVDGAAMPLGPAPKPPAERPAPDAGAEAGDEAPGGDRVAAVPALVDAGPPPPRPAGAEPDDAAPEPGPANSATDEARAAEAPGPTAAAAGTAPEATPRTHRVEVSLANARSGPGTENAIRFTLPRDVALHMIERDGRWGHFLILSGDAAGATAWMAFSTVAEAPAQAGE